MDINEHAKIIAKELDEDAKRKAWAARESARLSAMTRVPGPIETLCDEFFEWAKNNRISTNWGGRFSVQQRPSRKHWMKGWIVSTRTFNDGKEHGRAGISYDWACRLIVTTGGTIVEEREILTSGATSYPINENPSPEDYELEDTKRTIAGFVLRSGTPWPT